MSAHYDFECPHCGREVSSGDIPDHVQSAARSGKFDYECECGCTFDVEVEWDPSFRVIDSSIVRPTPADGAPR